MRNKSLLYITFILVIIFGALHQLADALYIYWTVWWFDNLMHFLGGFSISLLALWISHISGIMFERRPTIRQALVWTVVPVLIIGGLWEVFEYMNGLTQATEEEYHLDVIHDLIADTLGAIAAAFIGRWPRFYTAKQPIDTYNG